MVFSTDAFVNKYKGTRRFTEDSPYFQVFVNSLENNNELFQNIIFCNDILHVPPIEVFVKYYKATFNAVMTTMEKRGLGACFGYLFQDMMGYSCAQSRWVGDVITGIKNASFFIKEKGKE